MIYDFYEKCIILSFLLCNFADGAQKKHYSNSILALTYIQK